MKSKKGAIFLTLFLVAFSNLAICQDAEPVFQPVDSVFSLRITPGLSIPLGMDADIFTLGGGGDFLAQFQIPLLPTLDLDLQVELGYNLMPVQASNSVSLLAVGAGRGVSWEFVPRLIAGAYVQGGVYYAFLNDTSAVGASSSTGSANPFFSGGASFDFLLFPTTETFSD